MTTKVAPITVENLGDQARKLPDLELVQLVEQLQQLVDDLPLPETATLDEAIALYVADQCSLGRAAELVGMHQWAFRDALKERDIPIYAVGRRTAEEIDHLADRLEQAGIL